MILHLCRTIILPVLFGFIFEGPAQTVSTVGKIPPPAGFHRLSYPGHSFAGWIENIRLRKDNTVYLYNGNPKLNQAAQFAVLDIPVGNQDLQQCADAVMRLRAMWLHEEGRDNEIHFEDNDGKSYHYTSSRDETKFDSYLRTVFNYCGTLSLEKQLKVRPTAAIEIGDVFIRGGTPGHAMIVVDKAVNEKGDIVFMLAQSYMPGQDIHIVKNPARPDFGPWYPLEAGKPILTPEWTFAYNQLKTW